MPKLKSIDFSKGAVASGYFSHASTSPAPDPEEKPSKVSTTGKRKVGRPKKKDEEKSNKQIQSVYLSPTTILLMEKYMEKKEVKKSDLIEIALIEYMKNNP